MASKKDIGKKSGKQSVYSKNVGGTDHLNGLRVRLTVTLNALSLMTAPFISVTVIKREELPLDRSPSTVYIIHIPGLCAGSSVEPRYDAPEYIVFVRHEKSTSAQNLPNNAALNGI